MGKHTGGFFYEIIKLVEIDEFRGVSECVCDLQDQELPDAEKADRELAESPEEGHC